MISVFFFFFFFNDTATTEIYTLSLHDALPISSDGAKAGSVGVCRCDGLGSGARYGSEHDQRECGVGDGVEDIERLERAEPLCECDDEAGYGRAGADTEVARDAVKSKGGRSLLALD